MIAQLLEFLNGKKTYIGAAIVFVAGGLLATKTIDQNTFEILVSIGGSIAAFGIRLALKKLE